MKLDAHTLVALAASQTGLLAVVTPGANKPVPFPVTRLGEVPAGSSLGAYLFGEPEDGLFAVAVMQDGSTWTRRPTRAWRCDEDLVQVARDCDPGAMEEGSAVVRSTDFLLAGCS